MMSRGGFNSLLAVAVSILIQSATSHTLMQHPVPFASQLRDNGPMEKDGSNWPCKGEVDYEPDGVMNIWERGSTQYLQAMGGASHGGGSCQISITTDLKPTIKSEWRVIHSIHGGCPLRNLTEVNYGDSPTVLLPSVFNFTIPEWVPVGRVVMAWTWYGRWSVPEMFMNCAPVMVLGGEGYKNTPDADHEKRFKQAPLMFEANNGNGCWTANAGSCIHFPEPGDSLEVNPECPFKPDIMFNGTCGPDVRLANIGAHDGSSWSSPLAIFFFILVSPGLLQASLTALGSAVLFLASILTVRMGYLTMTADLIVKLVVTYIYTRRQRGLFTTAEKSLGVCVEDKQESYSLGVIATVVGWREDEELYRNCLRGFAEDPDCTKVVAGIDGDTVDDEDMVNTFLETFPDGVVLRLQERLSQRLDRHIMSQELRQLESGETTDDHMEYLLDWIRSELSEALAPRSIEDIKAICIVQPHHSKKDILMTTLAFATAIAEDLGIEPLFSTDSDSELYPGALGQIAACLDSDSRIGGVAGHLRFVHPKPTFLSRMTASHYWFEQQIAKCQGSIFGATECQPGPCAGFRVSALKSVLVPWYTQTFCGHRTVTNEDRHLTTRLLWAGYSVHYVPTAIIRTETPCEFVGWIKQQVSGAISLHRDNLWDNNASQVRWSRGTMIETLYYPWMVGQLSSWHVYNIIKARLIPLATFWFVIKCALGCDAPVESGNAWLTDVFYTLALQVIFTIQLGPDITEASDIVWLVPSIVWFFVMSPGIVVWSLLTILDDSWGNLPRAISWKSPETKSVQDASITQHSGGLIFNESKWKYVGFQAVWLVVLGIATVRSVFGFLE
ncbi:hypothetical protein NM208_g5355 [Fusarium decemcellulare]|uniref:Uncharacterized protein n=1 Tax=Fusarium decemcellulare TaxID=57161 RepID=A0ACC1SHB8_9HYPO|nr:hypothetical protein NM208_g5355 [Fusarium decemcellulare]